MLALFLSVSIWIFLPRAEVPPVTSHLTLPWPDSMLLMFLGRVSWGGGGGGGGGLSSLETGHPPLKIKYFIQKVASADM